MFGSMMQMPLLISSIIEHADRHHGDVEVVSRRAEGDIHRTTYTEVHERAKKIAKALTKMGVKKGDRVATLAWNGYRHLELYFAVSGMGAVLHNINPRLHPEQIAWIVNHAEDMYLFYDVTFQPIIDGIEAHCKTVKQFILMSDSTRLPANASERNIVAYEDVVTQSDAYYDWPSFDENSPSSLCYTSGTTGNPKGVLYSHRSTVLHCFAGALPDVMNVSATDTILPVVPMFHVNAWGIAYLGPMVGCKMVFPGAALDGKSLYEIFEAEGVTMAAGVPTVWQGLLNYVEQNNLKFNTMRRTVIGGAACSMAMLKMFEEKYNVNVIHAWGMTETSPLGSAGTLKAKHQGLPKEELYKIKIKQGHALYGIDLKIVDANGEELPWDGKSSGDLYARGHWVIQNYFKSETPATENGWFHTGDVATIDADGYMLITDRSKDVIKSGGEWISSIEIENIAMSHPGVAMAACIALPHPKWDERPFLVVVKKPDVSLDKEEMINFFHDKVAKWQVPDDVAFVDNIPLGATGKMLKTELRKTFSDHKLA